ncbi:transcriptional regulator, TetR family [Amycolatopsis marina]|uniref:Transcriptional regulator, TetR family n=1 Tax=Amycolatopsis marina TaxID=490629 RepID=A0A1I0XZD0_9PSEU|nr:TetR/AcrR family transcriptional regulator [Amycolatopsis marina]SFB05353.1 transcriptional regulator, TetR family [Amycolatopsis marina]
MSELTPPRRRRRRTDADRSAAAILRAATEAFATQPNASVEDIATAAGVSRQTVYAHFKTREMLVHAVIDDVAATAVAEMADANLDEGPAADALLRLLDASWRTLQPYPLLLTLATSTVGSEADGNRHAAVFDHLGRVLARGQESGEFSREVSAAWLATAIVALGHAAGNEVAAGRMTLPDATAELAGSVLRLCGVDPRTVPGRR